MPLFEYQCEACGHRVELIQKFSDAGPDACAVCGKGPMRRLQSSPAIQFKGSGWYITDYARKGTADPGGTPKSQENQGSGGTTTEAGTKTDSGSKAESATPAAPPASETKS